MVGSSKARRPTTKRRCNCFEEHDHENLNQVVYSSQTRRDIFLLTHYFFISSSQERCATFALTPRWLHVTTQRDKHSSSRLHHHPHHLLPILAVHFHLSRPRREKLSRMFALYSLRTRQIKITSPDPSTSQQDSHPCPRSAPFAPWL